MFAAPVAEKRLDLVLSFTNSVPAEIKIDPVNLRKVLINLIGNAIKFTDAGGIRIAIDWQNGFLHGEVQDTGIGIESEKLDSLFEAFNQADNSLKREHAGLGIGLSIVPLERA